MNLVQKLWLLLALLGAVAFSSLAAAQQAGWSGIQQLSQGQRVKVVLANGKTHSGEFQSATDSAIVVRSGKNDQTFSRDDIGRVLLRHGGHRGRNALIGAAIGGGAGLGIGVAIDNGHCFGCNGYKGKAILTPALGVIGALIGAALPSGGWTEIYRK